MNTASKTVIALLISSLFLIGVPVSANAVAPTASPRVVETMVSNSELPTGDVHKYLEANNLNEVEIESRYIEKIGTVTTVYDFINQTISLHSKWCSETISFSELNSIATQGMEAIKDGIVEVDGNSVRIADQSTILSQKASSSLAQKICPYFVGLVGYGHGALWNHALILAGVNPAVALLIGLGEAAFWIWVSTHC